jgi:hypothetical protein
VKASPRASSGRKYCGIQRIMASTFWVRRRRKDTKRTPADDCPALDRWIDLATELSDLKLRLRAAPDSAAHRH